MQAQREEKKEKTNTKGGVDRQEGVSQSTLLHLTFIPV